MTTRYLQPTPPEDAALGDEWDNGQTVYERRSSGWVDRGAERTELRARLAELSYRCGEYIECDERPRPHELWAAMCQAQQRAAVYLNSTT